jgi:hypothetical protein
MLVFFGRNYMLPGWAFRKAGFTPGFNDVPFSQNHPPPEAEATKMKFFGNEWHYETNLVAVAESDDLSGW